ncbi:unnamed protein product, partial [Prorocentrum cordatum]
KTPAWPSKALAPSPRILVGATRPQMLTSWALPKADARAADARARRCALADDVADRIREVEQAGQHRLEERLAVLERRAAEHRAQVESQCEAWKEALGQRCGALEQRLWEQQGDRNDLVDSVLKRLPEAGPVRELREEAKARAYSEEVQLRRLSACEAKLSKLPALEAKVDFAAGQVSQQAEEQAEALRTAVEATQRLSQKLLGLEASCQQADVQAAALEARLEGVLDCGQAGASRGAEALELRLQQRVQEAEARAQRSASRLEQGVAQQLAALSRRVDEEGRDAQQQLEAQLQELEGAQHHLERLASELRAEVAERATDPAAVQQLEAQLGDLRAAQQQQLEKLGELEGAQRQQLAQQLEGLRELEGTHRQQLEHLATELRAEVGEKATDPGALQQLETNQQKLQDQMRELEGAHQQQLEHLAAELRAEVGEKATDPGALQQLEANQQKLQDQMRELEGAHQRQLEHLAAELRAEVGEKATDPGALQQLEANQQKLQDQMRELERAHQQHLEHLAAELRAEVGEKATDPGALQQLEANQQKLQDQMRELEGAHQRQLEHLAAELRAEVGEKATDPGALQQLEANQQKLQDQMRELERAHQQHLERLAVELRAEAAGAQTAESRMHGVVSELVRADQERRDRQLAGLPSREEFDAVAARVGLFEARAAELAAASAAAQAESAGTRAASARVADLAGGVQDLTSGIEDIRVQVAALEGSLEGSLARAAGSEQRAESACAVVRRLDLELQSMRAGGIDEQLGGRTLDELLDARDAEVLQRSSAALGDVWAELAELRAQLGSTDSQVQALRGARHAVAQPHDALAATRGTSRSPSQAAEAVPRHTRLEERLAQAEAQLDHLRDSQVPKIEARVWDLEKPGLEARTACLERQVAVLEAEGRGALPARKGSSSEEGAPQSVSLSVSALTSRLNRLEDQISGANLEGASLSQLPEPLYVALRLRWPSGSAGAPGPAQISEGELAPILQGILHGAALVQLQRDAGPGGASPRGITCWLAVEDARAAEAELRRQLRAEDSPLRRALPGLLAEESSAALQQAVTSPVTRELASRLDDLERSRELFTSDLEQVEHRVLHVERLAFATPGLGTEALGHPAGLPPAAGELAPLAAHARAHASVHQPPRSAQAAGDDSDEELDFDNEDSQEPGPVWQRRPAPPPAAAGARRQAEPRRSEPGRPAGRRDPLGSSTASSLSGSAADGRLPPAPAQVRGRGVGDRSPLEPAEPEGRAAPPAGSPAEGAPSASQAVTPEAGSQDEGGEPRLQAAGDRSLSALLEESGAMLRPPRGARRCRRPPWQSPGQSPARPPPASSRTRRPPAPRRRRRGHPPPGGGGWRGPPGSQSSRGRITRPGTRRSRGPSRQWAPPGQGGC